MLDPLLPDTTKFSLTDPILFRTLIQSLDQQDYHQVIDHATNAIDQVIQSQLLILHDIRAYAYSMVGQFDSAFQDTTHMMTYGEKYALGYQRIGNLYSMGGRYQDAINIYDQGLRAISMTTKKDKEDEEKEQQQQQKGKEEEKKVLIQAKEQLTEIIMKKHQSTDFMTALPAEIVYLIITHLSESAKMTCLQVSRLWRQRTLECIAVWKSITMKVGSLPEYSQLLEVVPVIGQHVELLQINFPMSIPYIDALNSLKEGHFNRLKSLTMSASADCHLDAHMDLISDALWQVKDTLTNIRFIDHGNNSKTLLLANLLLASSKITDLGYKTNGYLSDVLGDTSMLIGNISNKFTTTNLSLVNLELTAASIQQQEIASLLPHLPHLRRLVLFGCKSLNFKFIEQTLPQLQIFAHDARSRIPELKELKPISTLINVNNDENNTNNGTVSTTTEENGDGVIVPTTTTTTSGLRILYANDGNAPGLSAHKLFLIVHKHMSTIETIYAKFAPIYRGEQEALFVLYPNLRFDNIKRLSFWAYDGIDDWIMGGIRYTTTLHYLSLANVENLGKVVDVLMKLPTLETLRLSYVRTTQYSASLAQLFEKYAQNYSHSDTTHNEKGNTCTASSRSLKRISLRFCDEVTDQVLLALSNIPTLESLVIQSLSRVSTHAINTLLAKVSHHLTIFDASSMDKVGDDTMNVLGDMTKLTDIYLNSLNNVSDEGIRSLMHRMNHPVSTISIRSCPSVSTEMIRVAKYKLKNPRSSSSG
ncbi:hypothetical protein BDA99DRAFT_508101 [Phascolomyces articulosus]|uniref:F-box domain-containing protein n=1 Tax=Phascolomyces articulosus TaxID=60185 RepID=A0AAD5PGQ7_9FUNG|nr:hypothetical protein BDA99DRAFT_508101 [Phascolomyces articulosus]